MTPGSLSPTDRTRIRASSQVPAGADLSPSGHYRVEVQEDSVVLTDARSGEIRRLPVKGATPVEATVSDRGDVAVVADKRDGQGALVGRLAEDGSLHVVERAHGISSPELSADGERLAWLSTFQVRGQDPDGSPRTLLALTERPDACEFLEDGRLLVRSDHNPWSLREKVPYYRLLDEAGQATFLDSVREAEELGMPVREPLLRLAEKLQPGSTPDQQAFMADTFGYRTPSVRVLSPGAERSVFWIPAGSAGEPFGLFRVEHGGAAPVPALEPAHAAALAGRAPAAWSFDPSGRRVALAFEGTPRRGVIVDFQGGSTLIPRELSGRDWGRAALHWSPDGRMLAMEVVQGDHPAVEVLDVETGGIYPVASRGEVVGWKDGMIEVRDPRGGTQLMPAGPLDAERAREYVIGKKPEPSGSIEERPGEVQVGEVKLPVRPPALGFLHPGE